MATPEPSSFAEFEPSDEEVPEGRYLDRSTFDGLGPEEATDRLVAHIEAYKDLAETTLSQKRTVLRKVLADLQDRDLDLASIAPEDVRTYRAYLRKRVDCDDITTSYAGHIAKQWNSALRTVFGEDGQPGESLLMRGFSQEVREVEVLTEADFTSMVQAVPDYNFASDHYEQAFRTFLEVAWSTGARRGSLLKGNLEVRDVDLEAATVRLRHMKNVAEHTAVLNDRAVARLRDWIGYLRADSGVWDGPQTPVFVGPTGDPVSGQWVNRVLKKVAVFAGVRKEVTTHVIRKSVGTHIGKENPKLAKEQLGITDEVYERHYNQPTVEDRKQRRDLLPSADERPSTPEEKIGRAYKAYQNGEISHEEFLERAEQARTEDALPGSEPPDGVSPYH